MENRNPDFQTADNPNKRNNYLTILLIIIALLAGANIYLWVKLNQKTKETVMLHDTMNVDSMRIVDLDSKYNQAISDLQGMKGQNASLDSLLNQKEEQIKQMQSDLKKHKMSEGEYKKQVGNLQKLIDDLKVQITTLEKEKGILVQQKDSLGSALTVQIDESGKLKEQNKVLGRKALIGSLLKPSNMKATGVFGKGSKNKEKETTNARKVEKIKVCFDVGENKAADAGTKTFMLRLIGPEGSTMAVQSQGSGTFEMAESGEQMPYTTKTDITYAQTSQNVCMYWGGSAGGFPKGKYTAELYQEGYKIGVQQFILK